MSLLMNLNNNMLSDSGDVQEASRKAFVDTVRSLHQWKRLAVPSAEKKRV